MFTEPLKNFTSTPIRRLDLSVGVSYSDDLEKVEKLTYKVLEQMDNRVSDRDPEVFFKNFGSSSIDFDARVWIKYSSEIDYLKARHKLVKDIKSEFDNNNITIPFPIRTLDFQKDQTEMIVDKLRN
jgi:small conductance mechanosensitive channel